MRLTKPMFFLLLDMESEPLDVVESNEKLDNLLFLERHGLIRRLEKNIMFDYRFELTEKGRKEII